MAAAKHKVTVSVQATKHRQSSAERRAAQMEAVSNKQAQLKREAAERRAQRAGSDDPTSSTPSKGATARSGDAG